MSFFFEIHKDIPREGPGDNESTRKALSLLNDLPTEVRALGGTTKRQGQLGGKDSCCCADKYYRYIL